YIHMYPSCLVYHPASTDIYTLSLHDALPISHRRTFARSIPVKTQDRLVGHFPKLADLFFGHRRSQRCHCPPKTGTMKGDHIHVTDRKSTRLNSSHVKISYAVFCLKKKSKLRQ